MYGYIYLTKNLINNKKYIGQHKAEKFDESYYGSGVAIKQAIKKYDKVNFSVTILEWVATKQEANEREKYYITLYDAVKSDEYYNIDIGGDFGGRKPGSIPWNKGLTAEDDERIKLNAKRCSETKLKQHRKAWSHGLTKDTDARVAKMSHKLSDESKQKISNALKGKPSHLKGCHLSEETKKKLSIAKKGKKLTDEHKQKLCKSVMCVELNIVYTSMKEAAKEVGLKSSTTIGLSIKDQNKTAAGYHWRLVE